MHRNQIQGLVKTTCVALGLGLIASISTPVQAGETLTGLTYTLGSEYLFTFDSSSPGTVISPTAISGLSPNESLVDIGYIGNTLYGVGNLGSLYSVNPGTAAVSTVGSFGALSGFYVGADFSASGIRIVTSANDNLLVNPTTGALISSGPSLNPLPLNINAASGSSGGTMYVVDSAANTLNTLNAATGVVTPVGGMGYDVSAKNGFDISPVTGTAYFASAVSSSGLDANLYTVDLATGFASLVGTIGSGDGLLCYGLTVNPVPEPGSMALLVSGMSGFGLLVLAKRRRK